MVETVQIAVIKDGCLTTFPPDAKGSEVVLALPFRRFVAKVLAIPSEAMDDPVAFATPVMKEMSPFPDENPTVSVETLAETEDKSYVLAAALPEDAADDIAFILDVAKKNVTRVDALVFGVLRMVWGEISSPGRRVVLVGEDGDTVAAVIDGQTLISVRALSPGADMRREIMLGLLEAEEIYGQADIAEVVAVGDVACGGAETFAPVRRIAAPSEEDVIGAMAQRAVEKDAIDMLPESWRSVLVETRFKKKMHRYLVVAGVVWALAMAVLFGVPVVYGFMTDHVKGLSKEHSRRYREVSEMRDKVRLVRKYSDHSKGLLEIMKAISDRLPEGVELTSWNFRREDGAKFSGEAAEAAAVYKFKENLSGIQFSGDDGVDDRLFAEVNLTGPSVGKGGKQRFDMDCKFSKEDAE